MADLSSYINITANTVVTSNLSATGNVVSSSVISTTGNITGNYILGNGSQLSGLPATYGNANVVANLAALGSNPVSTTGNVTGNYILGNGSQLTGLPATYGNSNVTTLLSGLGSNTISSTGNITTTANISGGNIIVVGTANTGISAVVAGATNTLLSNTVAGFTGNVNNYTQVTFQNKSTGTDATADFILTADNGSDVTNYGDFGIINSGYDNSTPTNSLGNIVFAADTYLYAQGNTSNASQAGGNLAIGTTVPGKNVKIFAGGITNSSIIANISNTGVAVTGNVTASNFIGNISITGNVTGTSPNVSLVAGSYTYTFDNTGILTLPAPATGNEGGEIDFGKAANSTLSGSSVVMDQYVDRFRFFEGGGTNRGVYIDFTQAAAGVNTLLNNRVSGLVNAGTFVTMDNIKATLTSSGNRGLSIAAVSTSFNALISGTYSSSGGGGGASSNGSVTYTTTASASVFSWTFSGAADTATYVLTDTTNNKAYRITMMIGGGYLNNLISIERLV